MYQAVNQTIIIRKHYSKELKSILDIPENAHLYKNYHATEVCEVVSVSNRSQWKDQVFPGDYVLCDKGEGKKLEGTKNYWVMADKWVYAVVDKDFNGGTAHVGQ